MKIQKTDNHSPVTRIADRAKSAHAPAPSTPTRAQSATAVQLSDVGRQLASVRGPEVHDEARIERLRALVESGKLHVDAGAIADAMLREER